MGTLPIHTFNMLPWSSEEQNASTVTCTLDIEGGDFCGPLNYLLSIKYLHRILQKVALSLC